MSILQELSSRIKQLLELKPESSRMKTFLQSSKNYRYYDEMMYEKKQINHQELLHFLKAKREEIIGLK